MNFITDLFRKDGVEQPIHLQDVNVSINMYTINHDDGTSKRYANVWVSLYKNGKCVSRKTFHYVSPEMIRRFAEAQMALLTYWKDD